MFESHRVGAYIAEKRKQKHITQSRLAKLMGVSHQAVSNWERGESMPDISALPRLASILGVSVDELLSAVPTPEPETQEASDAPAPMPESALETPKIQSIGEIEAQIAYLEQLRDQIEDEADAQEEMEQELEEELEELEEEIEDLQDQIDDANDEIDDMMEEEDDHAEDIAHLREQIRRQEAELNELRRQYEARRGGDKKKESPFRTASVSKPDWSDILALAPFASRKTLDAMVKSWLDDPQKSPVDMEKIASLAPFLSGQSIEWLFETAVDRVSLADLEKLAPFASQRTLDKMVDRILEKQDGFETHFNTVAGLAPFLSAAALEKLVARCKEKMDYSKLSMLAPFLSKDTIDRIIRSM